MTEDANVTVMAEHQSLTEQVSTLEARNRELEGQLAHAQVYATRALDAYKERVCDQVRHYLSNGQLCKEEARNIINELDLNMTITQKVVVEIHFEITGVEAGADENELQRNIDRCEWQEFFPHLEGDEINLDVQTANVTVEDDD